MTKKQKQKYQDLLNLLKKGKAVLAEVEIGDDEYLRYRIITPNSCEFAAVGVDYCVHKWIVFQQFEWSCFVKCVPDELLTPELIVRRMADYDRKQGFYIKKIKVI